MRGCHSARTEPEPGKTYAFLIDVAGQDEANQGQAHEQDGLGKAQSLSRQNPGRDSTALKIVEFDRSTLALLGKPTYLVVHRQEWTGEKLVKVFGALLALVQTWKPSRIVIDATGVGEGL
jgi:hypothetical protein